MNVKLNHQGIYWRQIFYHFNA